jgi:putative ABC transport system substrate-binding protein
MGFAESDRQGRAFVASFRDELQKLGWVEGRNIRINIRWAAGDTALMQRFAKELLNRPSSNVAGVTQTNVEIEPLPAAASDLVGLYRSFDMHPTLHRMGFCGRSLAVLAAS